MPRKTPLTDEQIARQLSLKRAEFRDPLYMKRCPSCWRKLAAEQFWVCPSRYDGRSTYCKECEIRRRAIRRRKRREARTLKENGAGVSYVENVV